MYVPSLVDVLCDAAPLVEDGAADADPAAEPNPMASANEKAANMRIDRVEDICVALLGRFRPVARTGPSDNLLFVVKTGNTQFRATKTS